jgi:hypothetical protein
VKKVTLHFADINLLWAFAKTLIKVEYKINTKDKTITCICNQECITHALVIYKAKLIDTQIIN